MAIDETKAFLSVRVVVLRVLDNRTRTDDAAGDLLVERIRATGHQLVARLPVACDRTVIEEQLRALIADPEVDAVIVVGGTGLSVRDVAPESLAAVWEREIPGFGELFRSISHASVGTSAIASRACAGLAGQTCLFAIPGSPGGVRDAWDGILLEQLDSRHRPCNLVEHTNAPGRRPTTETSDLQTSLRPGAVGNDQQSMGCACRI
jgi:molybdenum cofactor biosynthesis protein B